MCSSLFLMLRMLRCIIEIELATFGSVLSGPGFCSTSPDIMTNNKTIDENEMFKIDSFIKITEFWKINLICSIDNFHK